MSDAQINAILKAANLFLEELRRIAQALENIEVNQRENR